MLHTLSKGISFLLGKKLQSEKIVISSSLQYLDRQRQIDKNYFDQIRISTLELISFEIKKKKLEGKVAELGVYKGKFARYINTYFNDRQLFLFDTFEGFDTRDINKEKTENFSSGEQNFSNTSIETVLKLMPFPKICTPVKGYFPDSAAGINDKFVFVSIDADLYEPIYAGLVFFYERLVKGGYIFIHDFNNDNYKGARKAVEEFCAEYAISFVPLPDSAGSAVIIK